MILFYCKTIVTRITVHFYESQQTLLILNVCFNSKNNTTHTSAIGSNS